MKKDKQKVIGEELSDERLQSLLELEAEKGVDPDYFILMRAYRALRSHDFERFLTFFIEKGLKIDNKGPEGKTLAEEIAEHQHGEEYLTALQNVAA
ncbi:PA4642 family protein [Parendozoicomonas haliclonae]|uniref:Aminopeptidase N n=1 Tax=Parendozoicomonas haliclonae TaxID=1960125 RepID=A0A1X7AEG6_9GAMM|nr:PA4642 family protein [Parendozoicomonas haliclonae]SMA34530.1 hypothetical protein EHSB41UT_00414 [Parendozoicomonas haliclonae]